MSVLEMLVHKTDSIVDMSVHEALIDVSVYVIDRSVNELVVPDMSAHEMSVHGISDYSK